MSWVQLMVYFHPFSPLYDKGFQAKGQRSMLIETRPTVITTLFYIKPINSIKQSLRSGRQATPQNDFSKYLAPRQKEMPNSI